MFELNGEERSEEELKAAAEKYNMDFDTYIEKMKGKGLVVGKTKDSSVEAPVTESNATGLKLENTSSASPFKFDKKLLSLEDEDVVAKLKGNLGESFDISEAYFAPGGFSGVNIKTKDGKKSIKIETNISDGFAGLGGANIQRAVTKYNEQGLSSLTSQERKLFGIYQKNQKNIDKSINDLNTFLNENKTEQVDLAVSKQDEEIKIATKKVNQLINPDVETIKKIIVEEFDGTDVDGKKFANSLTKGYNIIGKFVKAKARKGDRKFNKNFAEFTEKFLKEDEVFRKDLSTLLPAGVDEDGNSIKTKNDLSTVKRMKQARSRVADFILNVIVKEYNASKKTKADKKRAMELIYMLEQQHITAAKAGDGRTWFVAGTSDTENAFYPKDKKNKDGTPYEFAGQQIGVNGEPLTNRSQFFGSSEGASMDFRLFMNKVLPADLQIGLDTKENNKIKKDLGVLALLAQKSKNILEDLMSGVFDFKARKNEAMMARELVKMQVEFFMQHKMVDNAELQLHLITFGSNMSTASRRAAYVWGVQEGLLSNGTSGEYVYGDIKNAGKDLELEHGIPHNEIIIKLVQAAQGKKTKKARSEAMDEVFIDYEANIITKAFDKAMTATGVQSRTYAGHISGLPQGWSQRLYN